MHSDLGRVVQAIIREFERFPPELAIETSTTTTTSTGETIIPSYNSCDIMPELANLSIEELTQLNSDTQCLQDFVEELQVVQNLNIELDTLINAVQSVAGINNL